MIWLVVDVIEATASRTSGGGADVRIEDTRSCRVARRASVRESRKFCQSHRQYRFMDEHVGSNKP